MAVAAAHAAAVDIVVAVGEYAFIYYSSNARLMFFSIIYIHPIALAHHSTAPTTHDVTQYCKSIATDPHAQKQRPSDPVPTPQSGPPNQSHQTPVYATPPRSRSRDHVHPTTQSLGVPHVTLSTVQYSCQSRTYARVNCRTEAHAVSTLRSSAANPASCAFTSCAGTFLRPMYASSALTTFACRRRVALATAVGFCASELP